jgi:TonB family protein
VHCEECHADLPDGAAHCDCRPRLTLAADEPALVADKSFQADAPPPIASWQALRCESCGTPVEMPGLCDGCERIFRQLLEKKKAAAPAPAAGQPSSAVAAGTPQSVAAAQPQASWPSSHSATKPPQASAASAYAASAPRATARPDPTPRARRTAAPASASRPQARTRAIVAAAAAFVIAAAIGVPVGRYWFQSQRAFTADPQTATALAAATPATGTDRPPAAVERPARTQLADASPVRDNRATRAAAQADARARAAKKKAKAARAPKTPVRTTLVAAPAAANMTLAAAAPPPVVVASAPPPPPPPPAALGPFFEMSQVNQPPRVASQVEPHLAGGSQVGADVVVLRVLVSQAGHASQISLLRRAKAGRDVDDAVVAAVKRWTFTPAMKRGQAVSCWFNVAVPLR